ncbi:2481_t:CDS:1 [Dentiscutata erythropus]|uniref:2481_t:CDS:1 n=1 Tax=Dentiscutata erythropus TaxID=1348616 RepID=A0A9N9H676_9GLOM|nr:2481_t:CDS:1 [Dentiscutata erythropus]
MCYISANKEIKTTQIILLNYQSSMYISRLLSTKELKLACKSAKFGGI